MQKGQILQFHCLDCEKEIEFSLFSLETKPSVQCTACQKNYRFNDPDLLRQLGKFERLCTQIADSEEILSHTSVGIQIGERSVQVPYKILLTRLNSILELEVDGNPLSIQFRLEPKQEMQIAAQEN